MPRLSNDAKRQILFKEEDASRAHGGLLQSAAIRECRERNKAAVAEAKKELESASEALRLEPNEETTARYMRAVKRLAELRDERRKLWWTVG